MLSSRNNRANLKRPPMAPRRILTVESKVPPVREIVAASSTLPTEECMVCYEDISIDNFVQCLCKEKVCTSCATTFIDKEKNPACVVCKGEFDEAFLHRIMESKWMSNSYKPLIKERYYVQVMSDRETRMTEVDSYDRSKEIEARMEVIKDKMRAIKEKMDKLKRMICQLKEDGTDEEIRFYTTEFNALKEAFSKERNHELPLLRDELARVAPALHPDTKGKKSFSFACLCPHKDCKGMVDPKTRLCKICERRVCIRCHELNPKGAIPKHRCDENVIANIKLLREDTRSCPKCVTPIFRAFGCDQMFCTQCKIFFNWRTGHIDTKGTYHNPEATRLAGELGVGVNTFHAANAGAPAVGQDGCPQGIQPIGYMSGTLQERATIYSIFNIISEIPGSILPKYAYDMDNSGFKSRVLLMKGLYDKKKFCDIYYRLDRERKRRVNTYNNLQSLYQVASDNFNYFRSMVNKDPKNKEGYNTKAFIEHMNRIREEFNRILIEDVKVLGGSVSPHIPSNWRKWETRNNKIEETIVQYSKWLVGDLRNLMLQHNLKDIIPQTGKSRNHLKKDMVDYFQKTWPNGPPEVHTEEKAIPDVSLMPDGYTPETFTPVVQRVITDDDFEDPLNGMVFSDADSGDNSDSDSDTDSDDY